MPALMQPSELRTLLEADVHACRALLELLASERDALKNRDQHLLESIIRTKADHLQHLEDSAQRRAHWAQALPAQGASAEEKWQHHMAQQAPEVVHLWGNLKELLHSCRQENEINGKILARNQKTYARLMSILRGQTTSTNLYNAKGGRKPHMPGQPLGEA